MPKYYPQCYCQSKNVISKKK